MDREIRMIVQEQLPVRADERWREDCLRYSICSIITRPDEYAGMVQSFKHHGFREPDCEFLYLDNSTSNKFEAYAGYNLFLNVARGAYVILCHQDIQLIDDGREKLDSIIENLNKQDSNWAVCGNGGAEFLGRLALRITDPHGENQSTGIFPVKVQSLDENFIVARRSANLVLSHDLQGFHFYGADICLIADILGWNCYVVDFHLRHKSAGSRDKSFFEIRERMIRKYRLALRSRWIGMTSSALFVSGIPALGRLLSGAIVTRIARFAGHKLPRLIRRWVK